MIIIILYYCGKEVSDLVVKVVLKMPANFSSVRNTTLNIAIC